jgi:hypothetical protein
MYVWDRTRQKKWQNVEITVYGMRVSESSSVSYAGLMAYARTDHTDDTNLLGTRGYGGRMTYDGRADFEKETAHGKGYVQVASIRQFPNGMPKNVWIGYKFVVRNMNSVKYVKLEIYRDMTDGLGGGFWEKVTEFTDTGSNFGVGSAAAGPGIDPAQALTDPNVVVYFRTDAVNDMRYKRATIREIHTLP